MHMYYWKPNVIRTNRPPLLQVGHRDAFRCERESSQTGEIKCSFPGVICPRWHSSDVAPPRDITWRPFTSALHTLTASRRFKFLREAKNDCKTSSTGTTTDFSIQGREEFWFSCRRFMTIAARTMGTMVVVANLEKLLRTFFVAFPNGRLLKASWWCCIWMSKLWRIDFSWSWTLYFDSGLML